MTSVFNGKKAGLELYRALGIKASQMWNALTSTLSFNVANTKQMMSDYKRIFFQVSRFCKGIWQFFCRLLGALWSVPLAKYYSGDQIKKNEMSGSCDTYMGGGEVRTWFWWINLRGSDHLEDLGVDGRIILKWIFKNIDGAWTGLFWLRWQAHMNAVMNLRGS